MKVRQYMVLTAMMGLSGQVLAADWQATVSIPKLRVAEYHKPYVALWFENSRNKVISNVAVWYDHDMDNREGEKWLKDMRQWWRRTGRSLQLPIDGVTGATRGPGTHTFSFNVDEAVLADLAAGEYRLRIEAAREVGGRELLEIPFTWPLTAPVTLSVTGTDELGVVSLRLEP